MNRTERLERFEDMSPDGRLALMQQEDGDVILVIIPPHDKYSPKPMLSVEFCSCGSGGGQSPHTLGALRNLMEAIRKDNAENPQCRGGGQ